MMGIVHFKKCIQDSQEYGSDEEHMVSRVFFDFEVNGKVHPDLSVDIKQVVGSRFEDGPIEVGTPRGYKGPFNYAAFRDEVEQYYRSLVGATGSGIHIEGASQVRMQNNTFATPKTVSFEIEDSKGGW